MSRAETKEGEMSDPLVGARFAGLLLAGGGLLGALLVGPIAFVSPAIFNGPQGVSFRLIAENAVVWKLANLGFVVATVLTAAGLFALPNLVGDRGSALALAAAVGFVLAAAPWLLMLAIRLTITPGVAAGFVANGTVDPAFLPLERLGGALFPAFMLIASGALVALGAAIVAGGSLSSALGWACVLAGLLFGGGYVVLGDMLPAFIYFPTTAVGIVLLLASR
jgi:hypothetical protein